MNKALEAGVSIVSGGAAAFSGRAADDKPDVYPTGDGSDQWTIWASGSIGPKTHPSGNTIEDDQLIALTAVVQLPNTFQHPDRRLLIEAASNGWAYWVRGPKRHACIGVITDAQSLAGVSPEGAARSLVTTTERLSRLVEELEQPLRFHSVPLPCRWLPIVWDRETVRIGDAQVSFDPLAGRGLWSAIISAHRVASALDDGPSALLQLDANSRTSYRWYRNQRLSYYRAGFNRFSTPFWARRLMGAL